MSRADNFEWSDRDNDLGDWADNVDNASEDQEAYNELIDVCPVMEASDTPEVPQLHPRTPVWLPQTFSRNPPKIPTHLPELLYPALHPFFNFPKRQILLPISLP